MNAGHHVNGRSRTLMCDVIRELVKAPRTVAELTELCELSSNPTRDLLSILAAGGLVYIEVLPPQGNARPRHRYHWCPKPFEVPETVQAAAKTDRIRSDA